MGKNFLISGYGRSGTKFLSTVMNLSPSWQVKHEPRKNRDQKNTNIEHTLKIQNFFDEQNLYGEVNSYMRFHFEKMNVEKKGLLIRNPLDIFLSVANRKPQNKFIDFINDIDNWYKTFTEWKKDENIKIIYFHKMIDDIDYLKEICEYFDITDIDYSTINLNKKVNVNKKIRFFVFQDLPDIIKTIAEKKLFGYNKIFNINE